MAKKTPESKEAAAERRQRELALLTSGVAAFSLMGESSPPLPAPAAAPAPAEPAALPAPTPTPQPVGGEPEGKKDAARPQPAVAAPPAKQKAAPAASPAAAPAKRVGEGPVATPKVTLAPAAAQSEADVEEETEPDTLEAEASAPTETGELDLARLFVPSSEKKGTTLRITADHQQFFTNLGFLLGNGASAPDIIHNILNRFRADHEGQIQKAMKKQMRQLLSPKK